jgi:hypothetical protein
MWNDFEWLNAQKVGLLKGSKKRMKRERLYEKHENRRNNFRCVQL